MSDQRIVMAATHWRNNAALIADCHYLGYLRDEWYTLDPTYGRGRWWTEYQPPALVAHDLRLDGVDFRALPEPDETFDAVAFDPPYVSVGGRRTTTMPAFHDAYGLTDAPKTPAALQHMIHDGITDIVRVLKPGGVLLAKCQDYVSSGKLWIGTYLLMEHALGCGLQVIDRLEHIGAARPQPLRQRADGQRVRQVHARRNLSTMLVFQKPRRANRKMRATD